MSRSVRVLHLEDDPLDAELIQHALLSEHPECEIVWVRNRHEYEARVSSESFDLILTDHNLRDYDGRSALALGRELQPHAPIIVITGTLSEDEAVESLRGGATDYVLKSRLQRLGPAVARALREAWQERERRETEHALGRSEARLELALEASAVAVWEFDAASGQVEFSSGIGALLGYGGEELPATLAAWTALTHPDDVKVLKTALARYYRRQTPRLEAEYRVKTRAGEWRWLRTVGKAVGHDVNGRPAKIAGTHHDVTEIKRYEAELEYRANYDTLTGLANKNLFHDRLDHAVSFTERFHRRFALLYLDLDRFKIVNDSLGHESGDLLLKMVATRLKGCVRESDTLARLGGDEFAVVLHEIGHVSAISAVARKILTTVEKPCDIGGQEVFTSASIGVAIFPDDGRDRDTLLKNADTAMYRAKQAGRDQVCFYTHDLNAGALERLQLEADLRRALASEQFELHYQPRVDVASGRITSVEALIRWRRAGGELIAPGRFIPIAEETGLIVPIGELVLHTACAQMRRWRDAGHTGMHVAVNLSPRQFRQTDIASSIAAILAEYGLDCRYLELEITESLAMYDPENTRRILEQLSALGVSHAIDDFGTGYSSLAYLKRFPIDYLKIDRSFVQGVPGDEDDVKIVRAILALGKGLGLTVIAEGVETEAQRAFLRAEGCDEMQGYLHSKPNAKPLL